MNKRHKKVMRDHSSAVAYQSKRTSFKYGDSSYVEDATGDGSSDNRYTSSNKKSISLCHSNFSQVRHVADVPHHFPGQQNGVYKTHDSKLSSIPSNRNIKHTELADISYLPPRFKSRSRSPMKFRSSDNLDHIRTVRSRSRSSNSSLSRSSSPESYGHQRSPSPELSNLLHKYSDLKKNKEPGVAGVLKSVIASVLSAPDVKSIISSIPAGSSRDDLLKKLIEDQLSQSLAKNPALLKEISMESYNGGSLDKTMAATGQKEVKNNLGNRDTDPIYSIQPSADKSPSTLKFVPLLSLPEQPTLSPLGSYIKNLFLKNNIKYCDEDCTPEKDIMLLIDYQAKYFVSDGQKRILPHIRKKVGVDLDLYCKICRREFLTSDEKGSHEKSYLHLMITGDWWSTHAPPPKYLPMYINNVRCEKIFIWCIICFEKHGVCNNEQLFQHLKSSHHQFNMYCWNECYNVWPLHEWCLWRDVASIKNLLPTSTVNGFDWPKHIELCVMADQ